jgi:sugar O-acyltransferase (sialic acid O-acetyltransferase NeuD family)
MAKEQILLLGGGGHCKSVIEAIESQGHYQIAGILDSPDKVGQTTLGYPVIGTDDELGKFIDRIPNVLITVGQLKDAGKRQHLFTFAKSAGAVLPVIIASTAYVSKHAVIGEGTVILHHAVVNADAQVGTNVIVNTGAIIEHDAKVGDHSHISTGAVINGGCEVGSRVLTGSNAVLNQGIKVEENSIVGAGAVVIQHVKKGTVVVGNPAKPIL